MPSKPKVQYVTTSDGVDIAYSETGEGYPIIFMQGPPFSHVENEWNLENYRSYNEMVARRRRAIRFDSRGSGLSQRGIPKFTLDYLTEDLLAVANHLEIERFAIVGVQAGGLIAIHAAAKIPSRVSHLMFLDSYANAVQYREIPQVTGFLALGRSDWELFTESLAHFFFGWDSGEPARRYAEFLRECVDQEEGLRFFDDLFAVDFTSVLPKLDIPAVVVQHRRATVPDMASARLLASRLPNADLVLLDGFWNDPQDDLERIDRALSRLLGQEPVDPPPIAATTPSAPRPAGGLVTILFTDIEESTALTQRLGDVRAREVFREHERITREALARHGGSEVKTMGDGFMASFGSATSALECAIAMQRTFEAHNAETEDPMHIRIGLNAGEPIAEEHDLFGTPVIVASRIAAQARGREILVSNVVRELVAGRGFLFNDRGETVLRGFEDPVRVFEVSWGTGPEG